MIRSIVGITVFCCILGVSMCYGAPASKTPQLILQLKGGQVVIALDREHAPKTVARIEKLAAEGAYDHVVFHRVIGGFMAQTGDVQFGKKDSSSYDLSRAGTGGSSYPNLPAEFSDVAFDRGAVGMARAAAPDSGNSQFFICFQPAPFLNHQYTVFGKVIKGMDLVDKIKRGNSEENGAVTSDPDEIIKASVQNGSSEKGN